MWSNIIDLHTHAHTYTYTLQYSGINYYHGEYKLLLSLYFIAHDAFRIVTFTLGVLDLGSWVFDYSPTSP